MKLYHQGRHVKLWELPVRLLDAGIRKVRLKLLEVMVPKDYTKLVNSFQMAIVMLLLLRKKKVSVTVGYPQLNKKTIWKGKNHLCESNILTTRLFRILVVESIGNEKDYSPFWKKDSMENLKKLLSLTEIGYAGSRSDYSSKCSNSLIPNLWCSTMIQNVREKKNYTQTCLPSSMYTHVAKWEEESTKGASVVRAVKVRIHPNWTQQKTLKKWMGTTRFVYNKALAGILDGADKPNFQMLRNKYVTEKGNMIMPKWSFETPKDIRASAVNEVAMAYKTNFAKNKKNGNKKKFKVKYRTKRCTHQNISIPSSAITRSKNGINIYKKYGIGEILIDEKDKKKDLPIDMEVKIHKSFGNIWHLVIPYTMKIEKNMNPDKRICALDPGLRTFQTGFDTEGNSFKLGVNCYDKIRRRQELIDKLRSKLAKMKQLNDRVGYLKTKSRFNRSSFALSNAIDELHRQSIAWLTKNYDVIFLPSFDVQGMVGDCSWFNRWMLSLGHYKFKQRLIHKCEQRDKKLVIVDEYYTTKTCSGCGILNHTVGSSKVFDCQHCKLSLDRDINASINILLKSLIQK